MMKRWSFYLVFSFVIILSLMLLPLISAQAGPPEQEPGTEEEMLDCRECHWDIFISWEQSAHGVGLSCGQCHLAKQQDSHAREGHGAQTGPQACMSCHTTGYDPVTDTWEEDNVHCTACHAPIPVDHPEQPVPVDRSEALCGQCHIQAHFEWQTSRHGQVGVTCVSCHSQHTTSLKSANVSEQCANCHGAKVSGFSHSEHNEQGISCADCHLAPIEGPLGEGNAKRDHSFNVELKTCTACHAYQLHHAAETPGAQIAVLPTPPGSLDSMASNVTSEVSAEPEPVNPLGMVALSGLIGLVAGMATTPWLSRVFRRNRKEGE